MERVECEACVEECGYVAREGVVHVDEFPTEPVEFAGAFVGVVVNGVEELGIALLDPATGVRAAHWVDVADDEATAGAEDAICRIDALR